MQRNAVYIVSVNKERSVRNIVYAQDKVNQRCLSRTGLSHYADVFAGFDRERNIPKHIEFTVRIAKIQVPHFNFALHRTDINRARSIINVYFGIEQLSYTVERGFAARSFFDKHRNRHDRPDYGAEISDVFNKLSGIEFLLVNEVSAVAQDNADNGFHKQ